MASTRWARVAKTELLEQAARSMQPRGPWRLVYTRYESVCRQCGKAVSKKTAAWWHPNERGVIHELCIPAA